MQSHMHRALADLDSLREIKVTEESATRPAPIKDVRTSQRLSNLVF